ncbi:MAG: NfeD family protein [Erysipelotrichia bacterium]|nr:NfeD family protein [Erysipelotrichia bacterium]
MLLVWVCIGVGAIVIELLTPTALISIWFACGALIAAILAFLKVNLAIQMVAFFVVSLVSMLVVRPVATRYLRGNTIATNADRMIGSMETITKAIENEHWGEVYVNASYWSAVEVNGKSVKKGSKVKVLAIEGAKLIVKEV